MWSHDSIRRPDIVVVDKVKKETMIIDVIIDVAIPGDTRVCDKDKKRSRNTGY